MNSTNKNKYQPYIYAAISFLLFFLLISQFTKYYNDNREKDVRNSLYDFLITKKSLIEKSLNSRIYYTKGIAAYTSINPNISEQEFYQLAEKLIQKDSIISTMALSKDCIINAIFPSEGHQSAIGLNLLQHPKRRKIVESTIITKNTFLAGPVELIEGGIAFISYTPIFAKSGIDSSKFWGVTDIVILRDKLFNEINFYTSDDNYRFALRGTDGTGENGPVFWGDAEIFKNNPVIVNILLPTGYWQLASVPVTGWKTFIDKTQFITIILYLSSILISILILLLSKAILKIRLHEKELKALFGAMEDLIIEFNKKGEYVQIAPTNESLLILPREKILGKSLYDVFDKVNADFFMNAILECISTKETVTIDYPLEINSNKLWFRARLSYISSNSVLYVAHDNTKRMLALENLKKSEQKLLELNSTKDKLFSIIAHDLRSPFNTTLGLVEILNEDMKTLSEEEIKENLDVISSSLKSQLKLLENLLNWASIQTDKMELKKTLISPHLIVTDIINLLSATAKTKQIELLNKIENNISIFADDDMLHSILRNLISNSIKFTHIGGTISVSSKLVGENILITVSDNGIGMKPNEMENIFRIGNKHTTIGTSGEKGTGLGLALVNEMVDMHGGTINIESEIGKGSDFIVTLPVS
ncbi:MAG: CHASE domain-containing protein [Bacteroidetes bacterium]|nr:CHASE domain-containing protein [Bacteroidota bacterium]MBU1798873.1 CHASE domain-containing protein [Bacteroidota bacterium]